MYQRSLRVLNRSAIIGVRNYELVPRVWDGSLELLSEQDFERFRIDGHRPLIGRVNRGKSLRFTASVGLANEMGLTA